MPAVAASPSGLGTLQAALADFRRPPQKGFTNRPVLPRIDVSIIFIPASDSDRFGSYGSWLSMVIPGKSLRLLVPDTGLHHFRFYLHAPDVDCQC